MNRVSQDPTYGRLRDHVIASTGLAFYATRETLLADVIGTRLSELKLRNCSSYAELLADGKVGAAEMDVLIAHLTIGETSFFRDEQQFSIIRDLIFPDILQRNHSSKQLRIWSAGCATGAEPYSLAILLKHELADRIAGWQIDICATDLNRGHLARAAEGKFRAWALRTTPEEVKRECFLREGLTWTIHPRYKQWISFHQMNLAERNFSPPAPADSHFDLILCRNVMIYFAPEVNRRLIEQFHESLGDGGWLVVGSSEHTWGNYHAFRTVDTHGAKVYQKMPQTQMRTEVLSEPAPAEPLAIAQVELGPPGLEALRQLTEGGDWQGAANYAQRLLTTSGLNPAIHFHQALIFKNLGLLEKSDQSLRHAIYLDRKFAMAHYHLGLALKRDRLMTAASKSFENVLRVLAGIPDDAVLTSGSGVTATELKELAEMHLKTLIRT